MENTKFKKLLLAGAITIISQSGSLLTSSATTNAIASQTSDKEVQRVYEQMSSLEQQGANEFIHLAGKKQKIKQKQVIKRNLEYGESAERNSSDQGIIV